MLVPETDLAFVLVLYVLASATLRHLCTLSYIVRTNSFGCRACDYC